MYFVLFAVAANGLLLSALWIGPEAAKLRTASLMALPIIWVIAMASAIKLSAGTDRQGLCLERSERLREGIVLGLRGDHDAALRAFEKAACCDVDGDDADVQFHMGAAAARKGDMRRAERHWGRCIHGCADQGRFRYEIERERAKLAAGSGPSAVSLAAPTEQIDARHVQGARA